MKKKIIAFILCACLICSTCIPAYAVGAEGIIIGGGAAAAGITLTMPQVALIIAAGYGLIFAVQHADDIAAALDNALTSAAGAIENGIDKLTEWKNNAQKGEIALSSAPSFVDEAIKSWVTEYYDYYGASLPLSPIPENGIISASDIVPVSVAPAGQPIAQASYYLGFTPHTFDKDVVVIRAGNLLSVSGSASNWWDCTVALVCVSLENFTGSKYTLTYNGHTFYYYKQTSFTSFKHSENSGSNYVTYQNAAALRNVLSYTTIRNYYGSSVDVQEGMIKAWADGYLTGGNIPDFDSICPDIAVGGLGNVAEEHGIDNITLPDINVGESDLLIPDVDAGQSIDDVISDTLTKLKDQEMEWTDYINDVAVGTPSVSIPQEDGTVLDFPITDVGVGDVPLDVPVNNNPLGPYSIDLTQYFPFCIPFDVVRFVNILCADPEAPSFEWEFTWFDGSKDSLVIDLSPFDTVAQLLRNMEILLFIIGLALITREQIRG